MELKKYKIRSCIIYLFENQVSSPLIHGGKKLGLDFFSSPNEANNTYIVG